MAKLESYIRKSTQKVLGISKPLNVSDSFSTEQNDIGIKKYAGKRTGIKRKYSLGKCIACEDGEILENSKAFYCSNWKQNCKFTVWKNSLELYCQEVTVDMIKELINKGTINNIKIILPQTKEKCTASLRFKNSNNGALELIHVTRIPER